jgi:hypothetical protein
MRLNAIKSLLLLCALCTSCIREEPLNPEADILAFSLPGEIALTEAVFNQDNISVTVRKDIDLSSVAPSIEITEGAVIEPAMGTPQNFHNPVTYTVTAADGIHQRVYTVRTISYSLFHFDFEYWEKRSEIYKYEHPIEHDSEGKPVVYWDSSNTGVAFQLAQQTAAANFPVHRTDESVTGSYGAEMKTIKGSSASMPISAASLFIGAMNLAEAMKNPLLATRFGRDCLEKPLRFQGYCNYKPGTGDYISPGGIVAGGRDSCAVNAIFFRVDEHLQMLDGTNVLTHPNIIAVAQLPVEYRSGTPGDDYISFDVPFAYRSNELIDFEKKQYKIAVVFSSSFKGDLFEGVIGSCLKVDNVEIITDKTE